MFSFPQIQNEVILKPQTFLFALLSVVCALVILCPEATAMQKPKHIVLLGASVGKTWNIESLPKRLSHSNPTNQRSPTNPSNSSNPIDLYRFEYVGKYQFDKTDALQEVLKRKENKPNAIFIKECAAYFPGDLPEYQELMKGWVTQCKQAGVIPILTTVVPVVKDLPLKTRLKDLIKWILGRPAQGAIHASRLAGILEYNDWIKSYARKEGLIVLDLEAPVHVNNEDRSLRLDLHSGDGLHLNEKAYALLDQIVLLTLEKAFDKKW